MAAFVGLALTGTQEGFQIFAAHSKAVAGEASTLNSAVPRFRDTLQQIVLAVNAGKLDAMTAQGYVDQALSQYRQQVAPILKDSGDYSGDTRRMRQCNGPCTVWYDWIQPDGNNTKSLLSQMHGGSITLAAIPPNAGFSGAGPMTLTYNPPAVVAPAGLPIAPPPQGPAPVQPARLVPALPPAPVVPVAPASDPFAQLKELLQLDQLLHPTTPAATPAPAAAAPAPAATPAASGGTDSTTLLVAAAAAALLLL